VNDDEHSLFMVLRIGYYVWNKTPESIFQITRGQARNQFTTPGGAFYDTHCFVTAVL